MFHRQVNRAADGLGTDVAGASIGGLHCARAGTGHHTESSATELAPQFAGHFVVGIAVLEAGGSEDRDAWSELAKRVKAFPEFGDDSGGSSEVAEQAAFAGEQSGVGVRGRGAVLQHSLSLPQVGAGCKVPG